MKSKHTSGLSPSVESLVAHERVPPPQPEDVRARVVSRAHEATIQGPPLPVRVAPTGVSPTLVASAAGVAVAVGIVAAIYLGGRSTPRSPPAPAPTAAPTLAVAPAPPAPVAATSEATPSTPSTSATVTGASEPSARPAASSRQAALEEIQLLSRARQADARGDYAGVLTAVTEHERYYPGGRLAEEREVLRVKALSHLGRGDQARRAAARFRRQFPHSVLLHKVDEMLGSKP